MVILSLVIYLGKLLLQAYLLVKVIFDGIGPSNCTFRPEYIYEEKYTAARIMFFVQFPIPNLIIVGLTLGLEKMICTRK